MKIIAETPDEDILLTEIEKAIKEKGYSNVFSETFAQSFLGQIVNNEFADIRPEYIKEWTPSQRLWFYEACKEFFKSPDFRQIKEQYINLLGIYDLSFKEEMLALKNAAADFKLFQNLQKNCKLLNVDNYKKLGIYLKKSIVKGKDFDIKTLSSYYDKDLSQYVIELNSIKVPFTYRKGEIQEEFIVYGWSNSERKYSYEFLKPELLSQNIKKDTLDNKIAEATNKKTENLSSRILKPERSR